MSYGADSYVANGNISPSRFVKMVAGSDYKVEQAAAATDVPVGVSGTYTQTFDSTYHATAGKTCRVYGKGEFPLLELGGIVSAGDFLVADSDGKGVVGSLTLSTHQDFGARARSNGRSGELIRVEVVAFSGRMGNSAS
jgi:hypothetical protein